MQICEEGATNLATGIVSQAVSDYIAAHKKIYELSDIKSAHEIIRERARRSKKELSDEEVEARRAFQISKANDVIAEIKRFFRSAWYRELCELDGDYLLAKADEKYEEWLAEQKNIIEKTQ